MSQQRVGLTGNRVTNLQVRATNLDDMLKLLRLGSEGVPKLGKSRDERAVDLRRSSNVHRGREPDVSLAY